MGGGGGGEVWAEGEVLMLEEESLRKPSREVETEGGAQRPYSGGSEVRYDTATGSEAAFARRFWYGTIDI